AVPSAQRPSMNNFWGLRALAIALLVGSLFGADALRDFRRVDQIEATGSARRPVVADRIVWRSQVAVQGNTLPDAYAQLSRHAQRLRAYLAQQGIPDSAIMVRAVETYASPEFTEQGRETGRTLGYRLSQMFEV